MGIKITHKKCIKSHCVWNQWPHWHALYVVSQHLLYYNVVITDLQTSVTYNQGLFLTHVACWLWGSCCPKSLFPNPGRKSGPNLGNAFLQEKNNGSMMYGSETSAQIRDVSILLIFHLLQLVTWPTLIFEGEEYFSQREGVPVSTIYFKQAIQLSHNRYTINRHNYAQSLIFLHTHFYE